MWPYADRAGAPIIWQALQMTLLLLAALLPAPASQAAGNSRAAAAAIPAAPVVAPPAFVSLPLLTAAILPLGVSGAPANTIQALAAPAVLRLVPPAEPVHDYLEDFAVHMAISLGVSPANAERLRLSPRQEDEGHDFLQNQPGRWKVRPRSVKGGAAAQSLEDLRAWAAKAAALESELKRQGLDLSPEHVYELHSGDSSPAPVVPSPAAVRRYEAFKSLLRGGPVLPERARLARGWLWLDGANLEGPVGRFHIAADGPGEAVVLIRDVAAALSRAGHERFMFKTVDDPAVSRSRAGGVVLYVPRERARAVYEDVLSKIDEENLRDRRPLMARPLRRGISYGDDPEDQRSFGEARADAVFEALRLPAGGKSQSLRAALVRHGVDPDRPWLNLHSSDPFGTSPK
jgi:hypothetical protein